MKPKWKIAAAVVAVLLLLVSRNSSLFVNVNTFKPHSSRSN